MTSYSEHWYRSTDGLKLYYRDYPNAAAATPVLCIPGLTRNARDFEFIAGHIAARRRVLVTDLRGRGKSDYDPKTSNYSVPVETGDVLQLLRHTALARVIVLGTSRGGVIAMTMAAFMPGVLAGAILNDMGAELEAEGLDRIYAAMRSPANFASWSDAVHALKYYFGERLAHVPDARWTAFAHALYCERDGRIVGDYDPKFPQAVLDGRGTNPRDQKGAANLWKWFRALMAVPTLVLRGANSELLSEATVDAMAREKPDLTAVTIKDRGHVPFLDEPDAVAAIDAFLARLP